MMKYMNLISTLAMSRTLPLKQTVVKAALKSDTIVSDISDTIVSGVSYSLEESNIILNTVTEVLKYPLTSVASITQTENTIYPELPPGYSTPDKSAGLSWVIVNLRAVFQEVNTVSMVDYGYSVVVVVDMAADLGVSLTMSGLWSTLPVCIRHRFLEVLWYKYLTMLECYGVESHRAIHLYAYNNAAVPIGARSDAILMVSGGVPVFFCSSGGVL